MMSSVARLFGAMVFCALFATPAHAQNYVAEFRGECCSMTLESGEVAGGQYFEFVEPRRHLGRPQLQARDG